MAEDDLYNNNYLDNMHKIKGTMMNSYSYNFTNKDLINAFTLRVWVQYYEESFIKKYDHEKCILKLIAKN